MGFCTSLKTWKEFILINTAATLFLLYSPTLLDYSPKAHSSSLVPMTGPLEMNYKLSNAEHLFENSLLGPESIAVHEGDLYTGTMDGKIMKITKNALVTVAQTGRECRLPCEERLCGRPLGLRMGKDGFLYVLDGHYGLHKLNTTTGVLTRVLASSTLVEGQKMIFLDDMDIDDQGNVYMSDASTKWDLTYTFYLISEAGGNGRVIHHNMHTGETKVLLRDLYFPNGIQISHDGNALLISETSRFRILKYHLNGAKKGQVDVLIDGLPGEPDNIRPSSGGGYWVALGRARNASSWDMLDMLAPYPSIIRMCGRALHFVGSLLTAAADIIPYYPLKEFAYKVQKGYVFLSLIPKYGFVIEIDDDGKVLRSYQSPDGSIGRISQATEHDGYLYLGSFINTYLGRLKL